MEQNCVVTSFYTSAVSPDEQHAKLCYTFGTLFNTVKIVYYYSSLGMLPT